MELRWVFTILAFMVVVVSRLAIPCFIKNWRNKIKVFITAMAHLDINSESLRQAGLIEEREKSLGFITSAVSWIELSIFIGITMLIFNDTPTPSAMSIAKTFGAFLGGWLTIKILSNHKPWSDTIAGKAYYHTSLVATLLNVLTGFMVGWLFYIAWF